MAFNISVHNSCTILGVTAQSFTGAGTADVQIKDLSSGQIYTQTITALQSA